MENEGHSQGRFDEVSLVRVDKQVGLFWNEVIDLNDAACMGIELQRSSFPARLNMDGRLFRPNAIMALDWLIPKLIWNA